MIIQKYIYVVGRGRVKLKNKSQIGDGLFGDVLKTFLTSAATTGAKTAGEKIAHYAIDRIIPKQNNNLNAIEQLEHKVRRDIEAKRKGAGFVKFHS